MDISIQDPSLWDSAKHFAYGLLRRWYFWAFALLLDPLEIWNKFVSPRLPSGAPEWLEKLEMPSGIGLIALVVLLFWAAACTYHEERKGRAKDIRELDRVKSQLSTSNQPHEKNIRMLEGVKSSVETYFEDRPSTLDWTDLAEGLTKHMVDACDYGLFCSEEFADERAALVGTESQPIIKKFVRVHSMMAKKRSLKRGTLEQCTGEFRDWLIEAIDCSIASTQAELGN